MTTATGPAVAVRGIGRSYNVSHSDDNRGYELFAVSIGGFSLGITSAAVASSLPAPSSLLLISCKVAPKLVLAWVAERRSSLNVAVLLVTVVNRLVTQSCTVCCGG